MNMKLGLAGIAMIASVSVADAAVFPTFSLDMDNSDIRISDGNQYCWGNCGISAAFSDGLEDWSWTPDAEDASVEIGSFIDWDMHGYGSGTFNVEVDIAFAEPDSAMTTASGSGGYFTLFGILSAGQLSWGAIDPITFEDGSVLDVAMHGARTGYFWGDAFSTGVTFTGNMISAVPVPASLPLLLGAVAGLGLIGRRRRLAKA